MAIWNPGPLVIVPELARFSTNSPITANAIATPTLIVLVWMRRPRGRNSVTGRACRKRRSPSWYRSHSRAMTSSGNTIPNT